MGISFVKINCIETTLCDAKQLIGLQIEYWRLEEQIYEYDDSIEMKKKIRISHDGLLSSVVFA